MSRLIDKFSLMKNMNDDELREYIKTLSDNDKNIFVFSLVKMLQSNEDIINMFGRIEEQYIKRRGFLVFFQYYLTNLYIGYIILTMALLSTVGGQPSNRETVTHVHIEILTRKFTKGG